MLDLHTANEEEQRAEVERVQWAYPPVDARASTVYWSPPPSRVSTAVSTNGLVNRAYADHVAVTLGTVTLMAEDHSAHHAFWRDAAHGGLACRRWWGTPTWQGLVDRFLTSLDDPTDPHWELRSGTPQRHPADRDDSGVR